MDVHGTTKSVRRNSTPRNPKLNSVVACSREIRGARRGKLRPELPSCTCLYCQGPTARGWSVSLARFAPRAFSLLRCDFFPLSSLAVNIQSRAAHPARSRAELLEKFPRLRTMFQFSEHFPTRSLTIRWGGRNLIGTFSLNTFHTRSIIRIYWTKHRNVITGDGTDHWFHCEDDLND